MKGDERILGDGKFVMNRPKQMNEWIVVMNYTVVDILLKDLNKGCVRSL